MSISPTTIEVGATYFEDGNGEDSPSILQGTADTQVADIFQVSYNSDNGATKLTQLTINLGDATVFDVSATDSIGVSPAPGPGCFPLNILSYGDENGHDGFTIDWAKSGVSDDGTQLVLYFNDFDPGERLVFTVDVDEVGGSPTADGGEFDGTDYGKFTVVGATLSATFTTPHMEDKTTDGIAFVNRQEANSGEFFEGTGLKNVLPDKYYLNPPALDYLPASVVQKIVEKKEPQVVNTAGAYDLLEQAPLSSISGTVFEDINTNNFQNDGDLGIPGVTLTLFKLSGTGYAPIDTTSTDGNGDYSFTDLAPGTYKVIEDQPIGYSISVGSARGTVDGDFRGIVETDNILTSINLGYGEDSINNDFAEANPASLSGYVYVDADNDGNRDSGESPIANVTVTLLDSNNKPVGQPKTTNDNGFYSFTDLKPGKYHVCETQPTAYADGIDTPGYPGGTSTINDQIDTVLIGSGQSGINYNFGELPFAKISGSVFADMNIDNVYDSTDTLLVGVVVNLYDGNNNFITWTKTGEDGRYSFTGLKQGTYSVVEEQPKDYLEGGDRIGSVGGAIDGYNRIYNVNLSWGDNGINYDFWEIVPASISGYVYVDTDDDGKYDSSEGESPIPFATVTLLDSTGKSTGKTATTDASGFYSFTELRPGTYGVQETQPLGYADGRDTAGTVAGAPMGKAANDLITLITLASDESGINYNFGEKLPATIAGRVFADLNNDDIYDSTDTLLSGVTIQLYDGDGNLVKSTTTDSKGKYSFTELTPGTYSVIEVQPSGYLEGSDQVGTVDGVTNGTLDGSNRIYSVKLESGDNGIDYDFWEVVPAKISGYVFKDGPTIVLGKDDPEPDIPSLRDGKLTSDDTRLSGVVLQLCDGSGYPLTDANGNYITTKTNANGYYEFTGLMPGIYSVIEIEPSGYVPGIDTAGSEGGLVVNSYSKLDASVLSMLAVDTTDKAIVRISIDSGDAAVQYNFSEVLVTRNSTSPLSPASPATPSPLPAPPVTLPFAGYQPPGSAPYIVPTTMTPLMAGGTGGPSGYTWHLSIIDAGQPRCENSGSEWTQAAQNTVFDPVSWTGPDLSQSQWILADKDGVQIQTLQFGMSGATPIVGDWDGSGVAKVGVFLDGLWFLDLNGNGVWDEGDLWVKLGKKGDLPVSGDWNGDSKTDIGIFGPTWIGDARAIAVEPGLPDSENPPTASRPKNVPPDLASAAVGWRTLKKGHAGKLRSDVIDHVFQYGEQGDTAVSGDWNGDGIFTVGIFRNGTWFLDMDGDGRWSKGDVAVTFGQKGDLPVVGDWNGDGITKLGVFRDGKFYLDTNNNRQIDATDKVFALGHAGDKPVAGDWNGDGADEVGVYQNRAATNVPLQASR